MKPTKGVNQRSLFSSENRYSKRASAAAGARDFGENYLQEAEEKIAALADLDLCWHFIGPIQSNKTRRIAELFQWVHSIDRAKITRRLTAWTYRFPLKCQPKS